MSIDQPLVINAWSIFAHPPDDWNDLLKEAKSAISSLRKAA
ncbi:MAG: hypothetical protein ACKPHV_28375 [Microcystis panniformis]